MPWFDLPLDQLRDYRTGTAEPPDLDLWWRRRLDEARATAPSGRSRGGTALPAATVRPVGVQTVGVHTVTVHLVATTLGGLAANQGGVPC